MRYTDEEKSAIILQFQNGASVNELCDQYGISRSSLYRWAKTHCTVNPNGKDIFTLKEYRQLQRTVQKQEKIISILKSISCTANSPLSDKLPELEKLYGEYDVHTLCEALDVPRSTFYNYLFRGKKGNTWYAKRQEEYRALVREIFEEYHQIFGAKKIQAILVQQGHHVTEEYIADRMQEMGLISIRNTSKKDHKKQIAAERKENLVQQKFHTTKPNQIWVSDVTCFKLKVHYFYICVIIDLFSRKVISYTISEHNSTQLVTRAFQQAWTERDPQDSLIFHSDRGTQYTSYAFQQLLKGHGVQQSFSKTRTPHDNAVSESFFSSLKREELYRKDYSSVSAFKQAVAGYIDFYNTARPHKTLNNITPCQMEEKEHPYYARLKK